MKAAGFYKRTLPSPPAIEFSSYEGKVYPYSFSFLFSIFHLSLPNVPTYLMWYTLLCGGGPKIMGILLR